MFLRAYARSAFHDRAAYPEAGPLLDPLVAALSVAAPDPGRLFDLATSILDRLKPGLKQGYEAFAAAAHTIKES